MMSQDNKQRIPLDEFGLCLLGTALYLGELHWIREAKQSLKRQSELRDQNLTIDQIEGILNKDGLDYFEGDSPPKITHEMRLAKEKIDSLGIKPGLDEKAKHVSLQAFQFEWHHLYRHKILAAYLKPDLPGQYSYDYRSDGLLCEQDANDLSGHLWDLLFDELFRLTENNFSINRPPVTEEEIVYFLTVSDLCGPLRNRGRPVNSGYNDDIEAGVRLAISSIEERKLIPSEAAKEVIETFGTTIPSRNGSYRSGIMSYDGTYQASYDRLYPTILKEVAKLKE